MADQYGSSKVTDLEINRCMIISSGGQLDFKHAVVEFNYFEDIFSNFVSGVLLLNDSMGAQNKLSWNGEEYLELEVNKPGADKIPGATPLKGRFRIYTNKGRHLTKDDNENLLINFCSEELVLSEKQKISKSYKKKKISDIVIDIAVNFLKIPPEEFGINFANVEKTLGLYDIVIPKLKPLEAINWLATKAISEKYAALGTGKCGANYLFWKNRDGYHFRSLISICGDSKGQRGKRELLFQYTNPFARSENGGQSSGYWYGIKNADNNKIRNVGNATAQDTVGVKWDPYEQIISYEIMNSFDNMESHQRGMFANRLLSLDYIRRIHENADFDYNEYWQYLTKNVLLYSSNEADDPADPSNAYFNSKPILSNSVDRNSKTNTDYKESTIKIYPSTTNLKDSNYIKARIQEIEQKGNRIETTMPYRYAQLSLCGHNRVKMVIPGDPYISVGKIIFVHFPQTAKDGNGVKLYDRFFTGYYIVSAVRQKLDQENNFETVIEVIKDSYTGRKLNDDGKSGLQSYNTASIEFAALIKNNTF